ncbi:class C sortase [Leucobacter sp. 7(1)]|uniref:class C sortase n=1 Tax=Leucobacter sp. 7(1) TaxID=1255613 RepID=UPI0020CBB2D7|nr:class C sortase [Leucobacter sp. 7(1)]
MRITSARHRARTPRRHSAKRVWRFSVFNTVFVVLVLGGLGLVEYPTVASWVTQYNQSRVLEDQTRATTEQAAAELARSFNEAVAYNAALQSGALVEAGVNVASGTGAGDTKLDYWGLLVADPSRIMARLRIPAIDLDLPTYHGTADDTLLKGLGHLEGTSLPVGGKGTRSVITGHRGLADATMFTNLDRVKDGDVFSVEVLGQVLSYRVSDIQVVDPEDTERIRAVPGKDLMTLITCTPLGINTQRILITGERITPTPQGEIDAMGDAPDVPGFPWWAPISGAILLGVGTWYWRAGYAPASTPRTITAGSDAAPIR